MILANNWRWSLFALSFHPMLKSGLLVGFVLAFGTAIALGQQAPDSLLASEMVERYQDPPMFIWGNGASPATVSQHGPFISYQVNVDGNNQNITGDAANEPSIAVDPTNHNKMAIGW